MNLSNLARALGAFVFAALALTASPALAQDPCTGTVATNYQVQRNVPVRVAFCHNSGTDDVGDPIPAGSIRFFLMAGAQTLADMGVLQPNMAPNAAGDAYFLSGTMTFAQDVSNVTVIAQYNGVNSLPSTSIVIDVRGGPRVPHRPRLVISRLLDGLPAEVDDALL